jgi:hypothetical protein
LKRGKSSFWCNIWGRPGPEKLKWQFFTGTRWREAARDF